MRKRMTKLRAACVRHSVWWRSIGVTVIASVLLSFTGTQPAQTQTATGALAVWWQDYAALKRALETGYANLEWQAARLDLRALDIRTQQALKQARNDDEAKRALRDFINAFGDRHLTLAEPERATAVNAPRMFKAEQTGAEVCQELGARLRARNFSLPLDKAAGFEKAGTEQDVFAAGIIPLSNGKRYGVLRIPVFKPDGYWSPCSATWEEYRQQLREDCGGACVNRFGTYLANRLSAALTAQIKTLQARKIDGLLVDIGGNGGGSEWADIVARILAAKPLRAARLGFVRNAHWARLLEQRLKLIETDRQRRDLTGEQSKLLAQAAVTLRTLLDEARQPCDSTDIWTTPPDKQRCSMLNRTPLFATGLFDYATAGSLAGLSAAAILFQPQHYEYQEHVFTGRLVVLVDKGTASAAEQFAALLQDNQAALLVGEPTRGVGCGNVGGAAPVTLPHSRLRVLMPNCARYRKDGGNEIAGITPDLPWQEKDDKTARVEKLLAALAGERHTKEQ